MISGCTGGYRLGQDRVGGRPAERKALTMLTTIALALVLPMMSGLAYLALRGRLPRLAADTRGIALQTVVVIVVLLAIAGGVALALQQRGSDAIADLETIDVDQDMSAVCDSMGGSYTASSGTVGAKCEFGP